MADKRKIVNGYDAKVIGYAPTLPAGTENRPQRAIINGYDAEIVDVASPLPAGDILPGYTPTYYTPTSTNLDGYLEGIDDKFGTLVGGLIFKGAIAVSANFPTPALVETGWLYTVTADVIDNDPSKTNTGLSFVTGDEIAWNGSTWVVVGNENKNSLLAINNSRNLYVDKNRTDVYAQDGSITRPFKTIMGAVNQIITNADNNTIPYTIVINDGVYAENLVLENALLYYLCFKANGVVRINPAAGNSFQSTATNTNLQNLHVENIIFSKPFVITGQNGDASFTDVIFTDCSFTGTGTIALTCVNNFTVRGGYIETAITYNNVNWSWITDTQVQGNWAFTMDSTGAVPSQGSDGTLLFSGFFSGTPSFTIGGTATYTVAPYGSRFGSNAVTVPAGVSIIAYSSLLRGTWTNNGTLNLRGSFAQGLAGTAPVITYQPGSQIYYDNATSGLSAVNVQAAIDEIYSGENIWDRDAINGYVYPHTLADGVLVGKNTSTSANYLLEVSKDAGLSTVYARIENTNTTDGTATLQIAADTKELSISTGRSGGSFITSNSTLNLKDSYLTSSIPLSETGVTGLDAGFTATSIIGAINEIYTSTLLWSRDVGNTTTYLENVADKVLVGTNNAAYATDILNLVNTSADTSLIKFQGNNVGYMKIGCYDDGVNPTTAYIDYNQGDNTDFKISNSDLALDILVFSGIGNSYFTQDKYVYFDGMTSNEGAWLTLDSGAAEFELATGNGAGYLLKLSSENQIFVNTAITSFLMQDARSTDAINILGGASGSAVLKLDSVDGAGNGSDAGISINADVDNGSGAAYIVLRNNGRYGLEIGGNGSIIGGSSNPDPFTITTEYSGLIATQDTMVKTGNCAADTLNSGDLLLMTGNATGLTSGDSGNIVLETGESTAGNRGYTGVVGTLKVANANDFAERFFNVGNGTVEIGDIDGVNNGIYVDLDTVSSRGLTTIHSGDLKIEGSLSTNIETETAATTNITRARGTVLFDCTSNAITANLPQSSTVTGMIVTFVKIDSSVNAVTLDGYSSETINGATTLSLNSQWDHVTLQNNGTGWFRIGG